ncbi:MAG TPA: sulfurtransferase [Xanthomonadales bacterium]
MYFKHTFSWFLVVLSTSFFSFSVNAETPTETIVGVDPDLGTLVSTQWLNEHLDDADLVVLDCSVLVEQDENGGMRSVSARASYEKGHIPGAGFADLTGDLSDHDSPYDFALPTPEKFSAVMGALGVGDDSRVVLYDSYGSVWAARVWWMLRWVGFDRVAILDGGLGAWTAEGRPLSTEPSRQPVRLLTPSPRPELIADRDEVFESITKDNIRLIDAMPASHYRGEMVLYEWPGHIPGATNTPAFSLLDESGRYLPGDELARLFQGDRNMRTITYCGGGISASSDAFILTRLGFSNVAVYISSLQEWTADLNNPMEVDTP